MTFTLSSRRSSDSPIDETPTAGCATRARFYGDEVNLGAHVTIAAEHFEDPLVHLGSALPDVATIGGFRMLPGSAAGPVGKGVAFHHATDSLFHSHGWFTSRQKSVFDDLSAAGVGRGAARASAHVGVELLLDGELFANRPERSSFVAHALSLATAAPGIGEVVNEVSRQRWEEHLSRLPQWRSPTYFRDPQAVARRMESILSRRPRLAMEPDDVERVAAALASVQPSIVDSAEDFLAEMVELLGRMTSGATAGPESRH